MSDPVLVLIAETFTADEIGQRIPTETRTEIWAEFSSATRSEVFQGGRNGLNPELVAVTPEINYDGQRIAEVNGVRYNIYRTYRRNDGDDIELYLERRTGS